MIHQTARPTHLGILRIAVFGMWFGILLGLDTAAFSDLPRGLIDLHLLTGPLRFLASAPGLLMAVKVAALAGCVLTVLGVRPYEAIAGVTSLLILTLDGLMKSVGSYANHAQSLILVLALLLVFFPAADALGIRKPRILNRSPWLYRAPLMVAATITASTYAFIGARRLFVGGIAIYTDESILRWVVARTLEEGAHDVSIGLTVLDHMWIVPVLSVGMLVTTIFEILSPVALVRSRFRWAWLAVITGFHLFTLVLMNIFFWENLVLLAILFTPITEWLARFLSNDPRTESDNSRRLDAGGVNP